MDKRLYKFSKRLKELRLKHGWDQWELAEKLDTSTSNISFYENMQRSPGFEMLIKMAELFNESTDYIMGVSDIPRIKKEAK
jgi:transcriptional regulator with XRE-family HTH domain